MSRAETFESFVARRANGAATLPPGARQKLRRQFDGLVSAGQLREATQARPLDDMGRRVFGLAERDPCGGDIADTRTAKGVGGVFQAA